MTIQADLTTLLRTCGAGNAVYPILAVRNTAIPYIVFQRVATVPEHTLGKNGAPSIERTRMQIDAYAQNYDAAQALAQAIIDAMLAWSIVNTLQSFQDLYEPDSGLHRVMLDFSILH